MKSLSPLLSAASDIRRELGKGYRVTAGVTATFSDDGERHWLTIAVYLGTTPPLEQLVCLFDDCDADESYRCAERLAERARLWHDVGCSLGTEAA